jgi:hypothetical protein
VVVAIALLGAVALVEGIKRAIKMGLFGNSAFLGPWRGFFSVLAVQGE